MSDAGRPPRRVLVSGGSRTRAVRRPATQEIDEQTGLGEVYMRSLVRTQLRLALLVCAAVAAVVGGLPLLFVVAPQVRELRLLGVPVVWPALALLICPGFVGCGWWYVRHAEHNEREFASLVDRVP